MVGSGPPRGCVCVPGGLQCAAEFSMSWDLVLAGRGLLGLSKWLAPAMGKTPARTPAEAPQQQSLVPSAGHTSSWPGVTRSSSRPTRMRGFGACGVGRRDKPRVSVDAPSSVCPREDGEDGVVWGSARPKEGFHQELPKRGRRDPPPPTRLDHLNLTCQGRSPRHASIMQA